MLSRGRSGGCVHEPSTAWHQMLDPTDPVGTCRCACCDGRTAGAHNARTARSRRPRRRVGAPVPAIPRGCNRRRRRRYGRPVLQELGAESLAAARLALTHGRRSGRPWQTRCAEIRGQLARPTPPPETDRFQAISSWRSAREGSALLLRPTPEDAFLDTGGESGGGSSCGTRSSFRLRDLRSPFLRRA